MSTKGDNITVQVIPNDGITNGGLTSAQVLVGSTAPVATVNLSTDSPTIADTLTATATGQDPNSLPVTLTFVWTDVRGIDRAPTPITTTLEPTERPTRCRSPVRNIKKGTRSACR